MGPRRQLSGPPVTLRKFPSGGFEIIDAAQKVEEETLPFYKREEYYPMRIGAVIQDHYQVVGKLGYGSTSTVWLARDIRSGKYWALKVHINTLKNIQELKVYQHLAAFTKEHLGRKHIRSLENSFTLSGPHGNHEVFVMAPLGMSLRSLQERQKVGVFQKPLVTTAIDQVLLGLMFLHDEANVIHTDLHSDNLLIAIVDESILSSVEENEVQRPSARKQVGDHIIHLSQYLLGGAGPLTISDFGQARIGKDHYGNAMPLQYRAPEVILDLPWENAIDCWSVGLLAWDLLENESLFKVYDRKSQELNDAHHLAAMTALIGPPPFQLLTRSEIARKYWNRAGEWKGPVPLPSKRTFESLAGALVGEDKGWFLSFVKSLVTWLPEDRLTAMEAYMHPWLRGQIPEGLKLEE